MDPYPALLVLDLGSDGLTAEVIDTDSGAVIYRRADTSITTDAIDRALAAHLNRVGRVDLSVLDDPHRAQDELVELMDEVRRRLGGASAVFLMGDDQIGLLRVTRADVETALAGMLPRIRAHWQETILMAPVPVGAVILTPEHQQWSSLAEKVAGDQTSVPFVVIEQSTPQAPAAAGRHGRGDEDATDVADAQRVPSPVTEEFAEPDFGAYRRDADGADRTEFTDPAEFTEFTDRADLTEVIERVDDRPVSHRRRRLVGAGILGAVVVTGCLLATLPWVFGDDTPSAPQSQQSSEHVVAGTTESSEPAPTGSTPNRPVPTSTAAPARVDYAEASGTALRYTPPPPTTTTPVATTDAARPAPARRAPQQGGGVPRPPLRVTIPNPIPGQPPIVFP